MCLNLLTTLEHNQMRLCLRDSFTEKNTRGNGSSAKLPRVRTAIGKKSFAYQGALIFIDLDKSLRDERSLLKFKEKISSAY